MLCFHTEERRMPPVVRSLILKGFRSLTNVRIDFDNPTFLVGRNGAGKSNIGDALQFIAEAMNSPLKEVIDRRGGTWSVRTKSPDRGFPPNFGLAIVGGPMQDMIDLGLPSSEVESTRYSFEIGPLKNYDFKILREQCVIHRKTGELNWFERRGDEVKSNVSGVGKIKLLQPSYLAMPILAGVGHFLPVAQVLSRMKSYAIEPAALREMQDPDSGTDLRSDGRNAASVFEEIERLYPERIQRIKQILPVIVPNTAGIDTAQHGKKLALEFTQKWGEGKEITFEAFSMSDGTLRALGLLLAVYQVSTPSLLFVEEPEASIHPGATAPLLDTLRYACSVMQVVVSTQSPDILDAKWIQDRNIRVVQWNHGETHVEQVPEHAKRALREHLMGAGELLRSEALEVSAPSKRVPSEDLALFEDVGW
jgi:predicted ATPase